MDVAVSLIDGAAAILRTPDPIEKATATRSLASLWRSGSLAIGTLGPLPDRPARPAKPELRLPRDMPKRRAGGARASRVALLHAIAHIELNALDLACDLIARFPAIGSGCLDDWVRVADEEAKHFLLLTRRLAMLDAAYGDLPAHDGLWQAAEATAGDLRARLAIVPLVLEARGLDVTPTMIRSLELAGDAESVAVLKVIYDEEIGHVEIGQRWFNVLCARDGLDPTETWQAQVRRYYRGALKRPFNDAARHAAGMHSAAYEALAENPLSAPKGQRGI
jgi:uncharacterized ferritin-like protein (DUF455 family)